MIGAPASLRWSLPIALLVAMLLSSAALAHFKLNQNVRIFHIAHVEDGLEIHLRTPMPYLVAD